MNLLKQLSMVEDDDIAKETAKDIRLTIKANTPLWIVLNQIAINVGKKRTVVCRELLKHASAQYMREAMTLMGSRKEKRNDD